MAAGGYPARLQVVPAVLFGYALGKILLEVIVVELAALLILAGLFLWATGHLILR